MALGDLNYNYMPCGCYQGPWMSVTPPPRCAQHSGEFITEWPATWPPSLPRPTSRPTPTTEDSTFQLQLTLARLASTQLKSTAETAIILKAVKQQLLQAAGNAEARGEVAAYDCWQMALGALTALQELITKAREAETKSSNEVAKVPA